jgi:ABC-type molybdate transport system ATPase subunit
MRPESISAQNILDAVIISGKIENDSGVMSITGDAGGHQIKDRVTQHAAET